MPTHGTFLPRIMRMPLQAEDARAINVELPEWMGKLEEPQKIWENSSGLSASSVILQMGMFTDLIEASANQ